MAYIGNSPVAGENNSFKILDDISTYTLTFDGSSSSVVSTSNNTITYNSHRFITAQRVTYNDGGGTAIGGLADGVYYIIKNDQNTIKLAASVSDANAGTAIPLTSLGVGSSHTLNVAFDGVNTKFKATYDNGTKAEISRAAQLTLSVNGVIQQPNDSTTPTNGFGFDLDSVIIFSVAPAATDAFWGNLVANNFPTFDISDNTIDNFTGDNSTVDFTLSKTPANNQNILVTLDGVIQYPSDANNTRAYSVTNNILTFVSAPGNSVAIQVRHIGFAGAVTSAVTGFYGRTGNVGLSTSDNAEVLTLKVGTGTTFTEDLVVQGNARVTGILTIGTASLTLDGTNNQIKIGTGITLTESGGAEYSGVITATTFNGDVKVATGSTISGGTNYITASTNGSERIRIDSSGNFGIGTTAPTYNLDVESSGDTVIRARSSTTANPSFILSEDANTKWQFQSVNNSDNRLRIINQSSTEVVTINQSGRLGIGTASPGGSQSALLHVVGSGACQFTIDGTSANGSYLTFENSGTAKYFIGSGAQLGGGTVSDLALRSQTGGGILFLTNGANERLRITSGGSTLVGGNIPQGYGPSIGYMMAVRGLSGLQTYLSIAAPGQTADSQGMVVGLDNLDGYVLLRDNKNLKFGTNDLVRMTIASGGSVSIVGALSKGSGSFRIDHPLPEKKNTHQLVHSFIEGPQADLIYRGHVCLVNGKAEVNIDEAAKMTEGTFEALCRDVCCFTTNESDWTPVRGSVSGNILTIEAQDPASCADVCWLVIGERKDQHMLDTDWTDENGKVITEPLKEMLIPEAA